MNWKGILWFVGITFAITYSIEFAMVLAGVRFDRQTSNLGQVVIAALMWAPALAAFITVKWITREGVVALGFRLGALRVYVVPWLVIPACFVVVYGLTWLLGLGQPDWQLGWFYGLIRSSGGDMSQAPAPGLFLALVAVGTMTALPFVNSLLALGEEVGWRGYLLPRLMPLGKGWAYLISGIIWGLWHLPILLIGFTYPGASPLIAIPAFLALTTSLGVFINELSLRNRSAPLAAWLHGLFNTQKLGVWAVLFPGINPLMGGYAGLIGIAAWLALGLVTAWWCQRHPAKA